LPFFKKIGLTRDAQIDCESHFNYDEVNDYLL
jgi:hypothetical protein